MTERSSVSATDEQAQLAEFLATAFPPARWRAVLDAGCGQHLPVDVPHRAHLVGLDTDGEALARNPNIDEAIIGDVASYPLPEHSFDVVLCWNVLEHLADPKAAISNMTRALCPGGLLVVGIPNLWSLKGLVTKLTPHRFHVFAYRHLLGAGHLDPYPTYLRLAATPGRLGADGLERIYSVTYRPKLRLPRLLRPVWRAAGLMGRMATLGRWDPEASEHIAVFRRSD